MQTIKLKRLAAGVSAALLAGAIAVTASAQPRDDNAPGSRRGPEGGVEIARSVVTAGTGLVALDRLRTAFSRLSS